MSGAWGLSDAEAGSLLRVIAREFADAAEVFEAYEGRFLHAATDSGMLRSQDVESCMWVADQLEDGRPTDQPFPFIRALRLEGYLSADQIGRLHAELLANVA